MNEQEVTVRPLSIHVGAEVCGVDLTRPLSPGQAAEVRQALLDWKVIFFRDQFLNHDQHRAFAAQFGELTPAHPLFGGHDPDHPAIYSIAKYRVANQHEGEPFLRPWSEWHSDITAAVNPPFASILRGVEVPPYGGDTQWVNMAAVYRSLSPTLQSLLEGLTCRHAYVAREGTDLGDDYKARLAANNPIAEHPLITIHPETGERVLYVNPGFVQSIVGMKPHESQALLDMLYAQSVRAEYTVRFKWEPGSIAFWDNRATMHLAPADIFDSDFDRQFYRVTLMGEKQRGANGFESRLLQGRPIEAL